MVVRQQTGCLWRTILLVVVVVLEGKIFVFGVVFLVVFVVGIVQFDKAHDADIFLMADDVVGKMMEKCAHFEEGLHSRIAWRTGRQNLEGKEDGQEFFHFRGKGRGLSFCLFYYYCFCFCIGLFIFFIALNVKPDIRHPKTQSGLADVRLLNGAACL